MIRFNFAIRKKRNSNLMKLLEELKNVTVNKRDICCILLFLTYFILFTMSLITEDSDGAPPPDPFPLPPYPVNSTTSLPTPPYPEPHFREGAHPYPPYSVHYIPHYPEHTIEMGTTEVHPAVVNSYACIKIIRKLIPKYPLHPVKLKAFATARRDIATGSSIYATEPRINCGIRLEIPLIDRREKFRERKELLTASRNARNLLDDYLETRTEVNFLFHYLTWQWQRVDIGIEYRKDIWEKEIEFKKKQARLKSIIAQFQALGIDRELLNQCYCETYYLTNCINCQNLPLK